MRRSMRDSATKPSAWYALELDAIPEREVLGRYPYTLAAYADLHASPGNLEEARRYFESALEHQPSAAQQALLRRKRAALG